MANQNYGKSVVEQRGQFADKNWAARYHERRTQEMTLQTEMSGGFIQIGVNSEKEAISEGPCFFKGLGEMKRDKSKIFVVYGNIQISFFVGSAIFAKCSPEGEGLAGEGWDIINSEVIVGICTEFSEPPF